MKVVQEESSSIMALNGGSKPVLHRFKTALMDILTVSFNCSSTIGIFTCNLSFIPDPFRKGAQHGTLWIFFGRKYGFGWELLSRCGCRISVGCSSNL